MDKNNHETRIIPGEPATDLENGTPGSNHLFPVFLKLEEMSVLLIGGGNVALEKLQALLNNAPKTDLKVVAKEYKKEVTDLSPAVADPTPGSQCPPSGSHFPRLGSHLPGLGIQ